VPFVASKSTRSAMEASLTTAVPCARHAKGAGILTASFDHGLLIGRIWEAGTYQGMAISVPGIEHTNPGHRGWRARSARHISDHSRCSAPSMVITCRACRAPTALAMVSCWRRANHHHLPAGKVRGMLRNHQVVRCSAASKSGPRPGG